MTIFFFVLIFLIMIIVFQVFFLHIFDQQSQNKQLKKKGAQHDLKYLEQLFNMTKTEFTVC